MYLVLVFDWRVTRSLVSYDKGLVDIEDFDVLKGHQIIGELRQKATNLYEEVSIEGSPDHWWVTTLTRSLTLAFLDWRVTRSLVSYDFFYSYSCIAVTIEWSPDHWWVTTKYWEILLVRPTLKGHQIFGELRQIAGQLPLSVRRIYCRHHQQRHLFSNYLSTSYSCTIRCIFQFQC